MEWLHEDLRLIANPNHLSDIKVTKREKEPDNYVDVLKNTIGIKYPDIYLSELNLYEIESIINDYIRDIKINRIIYETVNKLIEEVIEENKFDFCLPFD
tara:strand:+ start:673 stop:969 length:297 start_codon:yes stop_codon:yes gene_type:complete